MMMKLTHCHEAITFSELPYHWVVFVKYVHFIIFLKGNKWKTTCFHLNFHDDTYIFRLTPHFRCLCSWRVATPRGNSGLGKLDKL